MTDLPSNPMGRDSGALPRRQRASAGASDASGAERAARACLAVFLGFSAEAIRREPASVQEAWRVGEALAQRKSRPLEAKTARQAGSSAKWICSRCHTVNALTERDCRMCRKAFDGDTRLDEIVQRGSTE